MSYKYFTIQFRQPDRRWYFGNWNVYGWETHPSGNTKTFIKSFERCVDAQKEYPSAQFTNIEQYS